MFVYLHFFTTCVFKTDAFNFSAFVTYSLIVPEMLLPVFITCNKFPKTYVNGKRKEVRGIISYHYARTCRVIRFCAP
jgi:hypothetical protein